MKLYLVKAHKPKEEHTTKRDEQNPSTVRQSILARMHRSNPDYDLGPSLQATREAHEARMAHEKALRDLTGKKRSRRG
jgi:hypothetical protein